MIAPSGNWSVKRDPQATRNPAIRASIAASPASAAFAAEEAAVQALLGWEGEEDRDRDDRDDDHHQDRDPHDRDDDDHHHDQHHHYDDDGDQHRTTGTVFAALLALSDADVLRITAFVMARSLEVGSDVVEDVGARLAADARATWQADEAFFDLIRDRATINAIVRYVAGEAVAKANCAEKVKTQKQIVRDCLAGANGRPKVADWLPGWLAFPATGVGVAAAAREATDAMPMAAE